MKVRTGLRRVVVACLVIIGVYLVFRAAVEPFSIDMSDPSDYEGDWGGPSLAGVLAVHMLPGVVSLVLLVMSWRRSRVGRS